MTLQPEIRAVLFDLDGTLLDTAPDMAAALNRLLTELDRPALPYEALRPVVSHGARGLIDTGFGNDLDDNHRAELTERFLEIYAAALAVDTSPFDGVDEVIAHIEGAGLHWGIVTNKPGWLTRPLLAKMGFAGGAGCVISGDALEQRKPHPAPLYHAAQLLGTDPAHCIYVGDAERDIEAGRAAGMLTLIALYGYIQGDDTPHAWNAHGSLDHPTQLLQWLNGAHVL